jgi:periplasmic divalent cation tolerance protein
VDTAEYCQVVTTTDGREAARALADGAVRARTAACAQVLGPVTSMYWWQGTLESAEEWQVVFKTTMERYPALAAHIRAHHTYDVPEILCLPVLDGDPDYLRWLRAETAG